MTSDETEQLRTFLRENVFSFEELETILFFARAPRRAWGCADVAAVLNLSDDLIEGALDGLTRSLLKRDDAEGSYRYAPPAELEPIVEKLRQAYEEHRIAVVQLMAANSIERVRSSAARRLADAFRLKGR